MPLGAMLKFAKVNRCLSVYELVFKGYLKLNGGQKLTR
jgi:hypothetical protein